MGTTKVKAVPIVGPWTLRPDPAPMKLHHGAAEGQAQTRTLVGARHCGIPAARTFRTAAEAPLRLSLSRCPALKTQGIAGIVINRSCSLVFRAGQGRAASGQDTWTDPPKE
ncbi:MAG: hypothetical protein MZV64_09225 [Ignavibacteriales bacterium]|nr:hypothetical protein [Ignavibacteriales bacterium]